jgi:hypothetical protein
VSLLVLFLKMYHFNGRATTAKRRATIMVLKIVGVVSVSFYK